MRITNDIKYVGVNDFDIDLFEGQYVVPNGMAYNSYVILDKKVAVMDTVDKNFGDEWLQNIESVLSGRKPDYLVVQHMEPDHSANIANFLGVYPDATVISSKKAFEMMENFFGTDYAERRSVVAEGDTLPLGKHTLHFVEAPMVHWPEVIVTYDDCDKVLFSADGFGKFGAIGKDDAWACEARRYYIGIVGKYGKPVQDLLKKAATLDIKVICPLHGPVLRDNLGYYLDLYDTWSSYRPEEEGIVIDYTSVYGNTKEAVMYLADLLRQKGAPKVVVNDLARDDMPECVEDTFRYNKCVLATTTYNGDIFPFMRTFIDHLTERNWQNKTVAFLENGSWAPNAANVMKGMLKDSKNLDFCSNTVTIMSRMNADSKAMIEKLADELTRDYRAQNNETADKEDLRALGHIGYGLYVVTSNDGAKDNGLIVNAVSQVADSPRRIAVTINKKNYSHDVIKKTGKMNVNTLTEDAPYKVFKAFGFQSGRDVDKFASCKREIRTDNGLLALPRYVNSVMSLKVEQYVDLGSHGMFICSVEDMRTFSDRKSMTYLYYLENVKPAGKPAGKRGWICKVCGYFYEGDVLPKDFICPLCKHGAEDFVRVE